MTLTQLGHKVDIPSTPEDAVLEKIPIKNYEIRKSIVRFTCPEFTSLCPITHQPDFARFLIDFLPENFLLESKSLKLFMASFRNHGAFHEDVTATVGFRIKQAIEPKWIRVVGIWYPRGGIPIDIFWEDGELGKVHAPSVKVPVYEGR